MTMNIRTIIIGAGLMAALWPGPARAQQGYWEVTVDLATIDLYGSNPSGIAAADSLYCMAVSNGLSTSIVKTTDAGLTWSPVYIDRYYIPEQRPPLWMWNIVYPTRNLALAISDSGFIYRTSNGGQTWARQQIVSIGRTTVQEPQLSMCDSLHGIATFPFRADTVFITHDGGLTWNPKSVGRRPDWPVASFRCAAAVNPRTYICVHQNDTNAAMYRTTDAGATWSYTEWTDSLYSNMEMVFSDSLHGWIGATVHHPPATTWFEHTEDGGATWSTAFLGTMNPEVTGLSWFWFGDARNGIGTNSVDICRTGDGGRTWSQKEPIRNRTQYIAPQYVVMTKGNGGLSAGINGRILKYFGPPPAGIIIDGQSLPQFRLYPNPLRSGDIVQFGYQVPRASRVQIQVVNANGIVVKTILNAEHSAGTYSSAINLSGIPGGAYWLRTDIDGARRTVPLRIVH